MKTIVGFYDDVLTARRAVEALSAAGFDRDDISLVFGHRATEAAMAGDNTTATADNVAEGAVGGAIAGGALGGLGGLLLGLGALAIPGIGPVVAAGPLAAALTGAGIGAVAGGLVGALVGWGIPEEEAAFYAEGVRRGGTLVAVKAEESEVDGALSIMNRFGPVDVRQRSAQWRTEGWTGYNGNTYSGNGGDTIYRTHFDKFYGNGGYTYDRYAPAYMFGSSLANDRRYAGRDWNLIEADVRRDWEGRHQGPWEEFKDAVRYGWEQVKAAVR